MVKTLTKEEVDALDAFRDEMLNASQVAVANLESALSKAYPKLDIESFIDIIDQAIDDFTYDVFDEADDSEYLGDYDE